MLETLFNVMPLALKVGVFAALILSNVCLIIILVKVLKGNKGCEEILEKIAKHHQALVDHDTLYKSNYSNLKDQMKLYTETLKDIREDIEKLRYSNVKTETEQAALVKSIDDIVSRIIDLTISLKAIAQEYKENGKK